MVSSFHGRDYTRSLGCFGLVAEVVFRRCLVVLDLLGLVGRASTFSVFFLFFSCFWFCCFWGFVCFFFFCLVSSLRKTRYGHVELAKKS